MSVKAVVAHQIPGRVRLSIAERRGDDDYFATLSERFSHLDGVRHVKANPVAGSIALEFAGDLQDIIERVDASGLLDVDVDGDAGAALAARIRHEPPINLVSGRDINPMFMTGVAFVALGLLQSLRGRVMVPAVTAFWYATSTFQQGLVRVAVEPSITDVIDSE